MIRSCNVEYCEYLQQYFVVLLGKIVGNAPPPHIKNLITNRNRCGMLSAHTTPTQSVGIDARAGGREGIGRGIGRGGGGARGGALWAPPLVLSFLRTRVNKTRDNATARGRLKSQVFFGRALFFVGCSGSKGVIDFVVCRAQSIPFETPIYERDCDTHNHHKLSLGARASLRPCARHGEKRWASDNKAHHMNNSSSSINVFGLQ